MRSYLKWRFLDLSATWNYMYFHSIIRGYLGVPLGKLEIIWGSWQSNLRVLECWEVLRMSSNVILGLHWPSWSVELLVVVLRFLLVHGSLHGVHSSWIGGPLKARDSEILLMSCHIHSGVHIPTLYSNGSLDINLGSLEACLAFLALLRDVSRT